MALRPSTESKIAFSALTAAVLLTLQGTPLDSRDVDRWVELRSRHFTVVSKTGEEDIKRVADEVERVRSLLQHALRNARFDVREPVVVLAVGDESGLRELLPQFWERKGERPVAAYWGGPYRHCIVMRVDAPEREQFRRVLHEYVHLLTHVNIPHLPVWLDEGLSEFWGTAAVQGDGVVVGRAPSNHLKILRSARGWIPLGELLALDRVPDARDQHRLSLFYAESWALVHYLMVGSASTALELTQPDIGNATQLQEKLIAYLAAGRFRALRFDVPPVGSREAANGSVRTLAPAESLAIRAACLVEGERPAAALPLLNRALATDPREASALETLGHLRFRQNDPVEAARWFDRAIETGSASHLAYFYRAILAGPAPYSSGGQPVPTVDYLKRSIEIAPEFAPAYMRLADVYTDHLDRLDDALPLVRRATQLEPENGIYWVGLSRVLVRLNKPAEAREAGDRALAVATSADARALVRGLLHDLGVVQ